MSPMNSMSEYKHDHGYLFWERRGTTYQLPSCGYPKRLLKPPLPSNESVHFLAVYMGPSLLLIGGRVYTCKPCFAKLEKGCKTILAVHHCCKQPLSLHVPVMVTTVFPDVKMASEVAQSSARSHFRRCRHNVAFPYLVKC